MIFDYGVYFLLCHLKIITPSATLISINNFVDKSISYCSNSCNLLSKGFIVCESISFFSYDTVNNTLTVCL